MQKARKTPRFHLVRPCSIAFGRGTHDRLDSQAVPHKAFALRPGIQQLPCFVAS